MTKRTALDKNGTPSLFHHHNIGHHQIAPLSLTHPNSTAAAAAAYAAAANNHHHHYHQQPQHLQYPQHQAFAMPQPLVPLSCKFFFNSLCWRQLILSLMTNIFCFFCSLFSSSESSKSDSSILENFQSTINRIT
mgnify:CR=1 FL=1